MNCKDLILKNQATSFSNIDKNSVEIKDGVIYITINNRFLNFQTIKQIIAYVNYIHIKYPIPHVPICFNFPVMKVVDKLSYTLFECICRTLIEDCGHSLKINSRLDYRITTKGITSSPLMILRCDESFRGEKSAKFLDRFNLEIFRYHYRKVLKHNEYSNKLGQLYDDIFNFQKGFNINYQCIDKISEVVVELVCNSIEHSASDCLLDFDLAPNYINSKSNEMCCGINITVLNISDVLLGDKLKEKIKGLSLEGRELDDRYSRVLDAYDFHQKHFSENYDETDFFNIVAFQHKISGRENTYVTGGTGLSLLIKSIEERADAHACYALSGNRKIALIPQYLGYDSNHWLGFNLSNDFFGHLPDKKILSRPDFFFPGTAYNLTFVMKVDEK